MSAVRPKVSVILLHEGMLDKLGAHITSSLTLLDVHDIARSCRTYGCESAYIAHPSPTLRKLAQTLKSHWQDGFGATYNPNRKEALERVEIVSTLDEAIDDLSKRYGTKPKLLASSARAGPARVSFSEGRRMIYDSQEPFLLMLGTGWGMSPALLDRATLCLEPIQGNAEFNHLSVRSACAIMLDRLLSEHGT